MENKEEKIINPINEEKKENKIELKSREQEKTESKKEETAIIVSDTNEKKDKTTCSSMQTITLLQEILAELKKANTPKERPNRGGFGGRRDGGNRSFGRSNDRSFGRSNDRRSGGDRSGGGNRSGGYNSFSRGNDRPRRDNDSSDVRTKNYSS